MGWHYILTFKCIILPQYRDFIENRYLDELYDSINDIDHVYRPIIKSNTNNIDNENMKNKIKEWLNEEEEEEEEKEKIYNDLSKFYKDLIDIWHRLRIGNHFYCYELSGCEFSSCRQLLHEPSHREGEFDLEQSSRPNQPGLKSQGEFECKISKKVNWHHGGSNDLREDYETFLKDIIVPITSCITFCQIESDDYGESVWYYTDCQLRNIPFRLEDKIKYVDHIYSEDRLEIIESRVIYKHSIPLYQLRDLNKSYGLR
jgi:hypothetical protein